MNFKALKYKYNLHLQLIDKVNLVLAVVAEIPKLLKMSTLLFAVWTAPNLIR